MIKAAPRRLRTGSVIFRADTLTMALPVSNPVIVIELLDQDMPFARQPADAHQDNVPRTVYPARQLGKHHRPVLVKIMPNLSGNYAYFRYHTGLPISIVK